MLRSAASGAIPAAALALARKGWPVFPCKPGVKTPETPHGFLDATTDAGRVERYWRRTPAVVFTATPGQRK